MYCCNPGKGVCLPTWGKIIKIILGEAYQPRVQYITLEQIGNE